MILRAVSGALDFVGEIPLIGTAVGLSRIVVAGLTGVVSNAIRK